MMSKAIHPEIGSIIRKRDEIHNYLYNEYRPLTALVTMTGLLYEIQRKHRDDELLANIMKERIVYEKTVSKKQIRRYAHEMRSKYEDYLEQINNILWKYDYLIDKTYMGITPASSLKKERETPERKPFPERLSEELENADNR